MIKIFDDLRNRFDFFLRNHITFSRKDYREAGCLDENILVIETVKKYNLHLLKDLSERNIKENLYFLNIFDKYLTKKQGSDISLLDIGSKNWNYVKSEYLFVSSFSKELSLKGI
jgi:hypothetical protein